jgi:hypothetical protein
VDLPGIGLVSPRKVRNDSRNHDRGTGYSQAPSVESTTAIGYRDRSGGVVIADQGFQVLWPQVLLPQVLLPQVLLPQVLFPHVLWPMTPQMLLPKTAMTLSTSPKFERIM